MKRTPALAAAAAALGLLAGLGLEARASTFADEVSPHTVSVAWLAPGTPAGVELDEPGVVPPQAPRRQSAKGEAKSRPLSRLQPMRARVPEHVVAEREARLRVHRTLLARRGDCPQRHREARVQVRRS